MFDGEESGSLTQRLYNIKIGDRCLRTGGEQIKLILDVDNSFRFSIIC